MYGISHIGIVVHMTGKYLPLINYVGLLHYHDVRLCAVKPRQTMDKRYEGANFKLLFIRSSDSSLHP